MIKISVILPVCGVAAYIEKCIQSLLNQTLSDMEFIFVDDHSPDNSIEIAKQVIKSHTREKQFVFLRPEHNLGPGMARNFAIPQATGEYIAFCDADDWVESTMYEQLYTQAQTYQAQISSAAAILDYPDGSHQQMTNPYIGCGEISTKQRKYLLSHFVSNFTTMLFRREWLNQYSIRFPDARSGEDSSFMGQCYLLVQRIAQTNQPLYHYVIHGDSISHRKHIWRGKDKRKAFGYLLNFAKRNQLWSIYRNQLILLYIKKALLTPIKEWIH
ncbi:MAG: glycosyltransferase [Paludibacteraceae bacterium]|nr:glycosyltransferase [Paludibacteraceae bacterium]